jgi:hypothetical protein
VGRITGAVALVLVVCLALPVLASAGRAAAPVLVALLVLLGILQLAFPPSRRRR